MSNFTEENYGNFGVPGVTIKQTLSSTYDPYSGIDLANVDTTATVDTPFTDPNALWYVEAGTLPADWFEVSYEGTSWEGMDPNSMAGWFYQSEATAEKLCLELGFSHLISYYSDTTSTFPNLIAWDGTNNRWGRSPQNQPYITDLICGGIPIEINSDYFYSFDEDKRPSLGLFPTVELNKSQDNFTDVVSGDIFQQVPKQNFLRNGDARFVSQNSYHTDNQTELGYLSFKPQGEWGYINLDGIGTNLTQGNKPSEWYQSNFLQNPEFDSYTQSNNILGFVVWVQIPMVGYAYAGPLDFVPSNWFDIEDLEYITIATGMYLNACEELFGGTWSDYIAYPNAINTIVDSNGHNYNIYACTREEPTLENVAYGYGGYYPYPLMTSDSMHNIRLQLNLDIATWVKDEECYSFGKCLKFRGTDSWDNTQSEGTGTDIDTTTYYQAKYQIQDDNTTCSKNGDNYYGSATTLSTAKDIAEAACESGIGNEDGSCHCVYQDYSTYQNFDYAHSSLNIMSLANNNEYRTLNQHQKIYSTEEKTLLPYSSLKISFWMKTDATDSYYDPDNPPYVEAGIIRGAASIDTMLDVTDNLFDSLTFPNEYPLEEYFTYINNFGWNKNYLHFAGSYNSITSDAVETNMPLGSMGRFKNQKLNTWEKKEFTFNFNLAYNEDNNPDTLDLKDLSFLIQSSKGTMESDTPKGFRGTVYLDNFKVEESYDFIPDVDVRKKKAADDYGIADLTEYYDKELEPEKYKDSTAPLEVQFYFYPRYHYENPFDKVTSIIHNDFREGMFYLYDVDWGDGSANEFVAEPQLLGDNISVYHTYKDSGIYEITGTMLRMKPDRLYKPVGIIHNEKFTLRININEGLDEDFKYFGTDGFSFLPLIDTVPTIGGYSKESIYYKSIKRQLGIINDDLNLNTEFKSAGDRLKTEIALDKMDSNYSEDFTLLNEFKKIRHSSKEEQFDWQGNPINVINNGIKTTPSHLGESIGDMDLTEIRYFNRPTSMVEMLGFSEEVVDLGDSAHEANISTNYLATLPFPYFFEELDQNGDGIVDSTDLQFWMQQGRPDVAEYIEKGILLTPILTVGFNVVNWGGDLIFNLPYIVESQLEYFDLPLNTITQDDNSGGHHWNQFINNGIISWEIPTGFDYETDTVQAYFTAPPPHVPDGAVGYPREIEHFYNESAKTLMDRAGNPSSNLYWKNIIPNDYDITNRQDLFYNSSENNLNLTKTACLMPPNTIYYHEGSVLYNFNFDVGGFQFNMNPTGEGWSNLETPPITDGGYAIYGGTAADAGFTIQGAGLTVLGFSLTGGFIPAGCGELMNFGTSEPLGEGITITSLNGIVINNTTGDPEINNEDIYNYQTELFYSRVPEGIINPNSEQEWFDDYYYPVLPKYAVNGRFIEDDFPNNKIPFPMEGPITNLDYGEEYLEIYINNDKVDTGTFDDNSGRKNYGFAYSDYRPNFDKETFKPVKRKFVDSPETSKNEGAF